MATQQLKIWAEQLTIDGLSNAPQRKELSTEEFLDGWLRNDSISAQQLNTILHLLTMYSSPFLSTAYCVPSTPIPEGSLELNGQAITEVDYPNAYAAYGATLPDITSEAPTGFTYVIRAT